MAYQIISLLFLITAIVLGFTKKMNVGVVSMGMAFIRLTFCQRQDQEQYLFSLL